MEREYLNCNENSHRQKSMETIRSRVIALSEDRDLHEKSTREER